MPCPPYICRSIEQLSESYLIQDKILMINITSYLLKYYEIPYNNIEGKICSQQKENELLWTVVTLRRSLYLVN